MHDAIIIGSGPAGSHCAQLLAKIGYDVLLLEGRTTPKKSINCTGVIGSEAFSRFNLQDVPVLNRINKFKFISPNNQTFVFESSSELACVVKRSHLDSLLVKRAIDAGATFRNSSWVTKIMPEKTGVKFKIFYKGQIKELKAKVGIIATGFGSQLIEMVGLTNPPGCIEGVQAEVAGTDFDLVEVYLGNRIAPASFAWFVPLSEKRAFVGLTTSKNCVLYLNNFINKLKKEKSIHKIKNQHRKYLPLGFVQKGCTDRIIVIGEAAGQIKTTTHGGIYYGMIEGEIAARVIDKAFKKGQYNESILCLYDNLWKAEIGKEIGVGLKLRRLYSRLDDAKINKLFTIVNVDGVLPLIRRYFDFDWHQGLIQSLLENPVVRGVLNI